VMKDSDSPKNVGESGNYLFTDYHHIIACFIGILSQYNK